MKRTLQLILILLLTISCETPLDSCFSPPPQFIFDFADSETLENLFFNETFTEDAIKVYDETAKEIDFELVLHEEKYILFLSDIGWELEPKTYTIELSPEISVIFELDVDQLKSGNCTYFEIKKINILDYEYEEQPTTGIIQIKIVVSN